MKRSIFLVILAMSMFLAVSCEKEIRFVGEYSGEKLVLYSCAVPGQNLEAEVYKSKFFLSVKDDNVYDFIADAIVTAEVNGKVYPMEYMSFGESGTVENDFDTKEDTYQRYVADYLPKAGDHIVIRASKPGFSGVWGETVVPEEPKFSIDSYSVNTLEEMDGWRFSKSELSFRITVDDPSEITNYYALGLDCVSSYEEEEGSSVEIRTKMSLYSNDVIFMDATVGFSDIGGIFDGQSEPFIPSCFDDGAFNGTKYSFKVSTTIWTYTQEDEDAEKDLDISMFELELANLSDDMFLYMRSADTYRSNFFGSDLGEPVAIHSNVHNGIGCVCARNSTTRRPALLKSLP